MALDKDRLKNNIVNRIETDYGITFTPAQRIQAEKIWNLVAEEIINEFKNFAKLNFASAEIKINPGTFSAPGGGGAITGQGENAVVSLKGSIT